MRRNNNSMASRGGGGGPLMTNHLLDLELELELLKRKRQLIQQQQNEMLYRTPDTQRYDQLPQMFNDRFNEPSQRNFSHLYDETIRDNRPFAPKRRAEAEWGDSMSDRFGGPLSGNKKPRQGLLPTQPFMAHNGSQPFQRPRPNPLPSLLGAPKPLMSLAPRGNRRPPPTRNPARQNQSAKPPTQQVNFKRNSKQFVPNKPNNPPKKTGPVNPNPRQFVPNKANIPPKKTGPVKKEIKKNVVLSAAVEPSQKVTGRLELALGTLVKEMKEACKDSEYMSLFHSTVLARLFKQTIRDRVRAVMVGKVVGAVPEIIAEYRKTYPSTADVEVFKLVASEKLKQEQKAQLAIKLLEEGDPETYFKKNMTNLFKVKLDEMFRKVEQALGDQTQVKTEILENLPEITKSPGEDCFVNDPQESEFNLVTKPNPKEVEYNKWMSLLIERKLPQLLGKHKDEIIRLLDLDQMFRDTKAAIVINTHNQTLNMIKKNKDRQINVPRKPDNPDLPRSNLFFAKVKAHPSMPKRKLMQEFLDQFNPKTIKRHKKNYNLLFIGMSDKVDYDRILEANRAQIGNSTLTITGNTKNMVIEIDEENTSDAALDQILTSQLDDQINDLLSSIGQSDENEKTVSEDLDVEEVKTKSDVIEINEDGEGEDKAYEIENRSEETNGNDSDVQEIKGDDNVQESTQEEKADANEKQSDLVTVEDDDQVTPLESDEQATEAKRTPAKARAPATPSTIQTRRTSRLAQNN